MAKKGFVKKLLALMLSASMLFPSQASLAKMPDGEQEAASVYATREDSRREQINFNRNWKFIRSDAEGAADAKYDDSGWIDVGLPHNFSIPYEMSAQFYVGYGWYRKEFEVPADWADKRIEPGI